MVSQVSVTCKISFEGHNRVNYKFSKLLVLTVVNVMNFNEFKR